MKVKKAVSGGGPVLTRRRVADHAKAEATKAAREKLDREREQRAREVRTAACAKNIIAG